MMKRNAPGWILALVTAVIICAAWQKIIFSPNHYLLTTGGDAFKNYYTPAWYVANDKGDHFTGMNYPYGEHVVFTDDQPMITWLINVIDDHVFPVHDHTVAILHLLMFISLWAGVLLIFHILRHYRMPAWYAAGMALLIGLMTPQLDRFWGHFALSYALFVPLIWWLMIRLEKKNYAFRRAALLAAVVIFFGFIHMYYALIASLFIGFYALTILCRSFRKWRLSLYIMALAAIPVVAILGFMHVTDHVHDRPETPYGFFRYKASFQSVFLPKHGTLTTQLQKHLHVGHANPEGYAYVGYAGLLFLFVLLVIFTKRILYKRNIRRSLIMLPEGLSIYVWTGIAMLLFSMSLPFSLGLQSLLDILTPLKQFRSPGRFAWGFYYVYMVTIAVLSWMIFKKIKKRQRILSYVFIFIFCGILTADSLTYFFQTSRDLQKANAENPFDGKTTYFSDALLGTNYTEKDFDAILFLPSFFQGSEKLYIDRTDGHLSKAMELSYQTHLPMVNYMMSRTSLSQTFANVQLVSHPFIPVNTVESSVFSAKRLLVMVKTDKILTAGEQYIVDHSTKISERGGFTFHVFDVAKAMDKGEDMAKKVYRSEADSLKVFDNNGMPYSSIHELALMYYDGFEENSMFTGEAFRGKQGIVVNGDWKEIADIPVHISAPIWIETSIWAKNAPSDMAYPYLLLEFFDDKGNKLFESSVAPTQSVDVMNGWVRASTDLELKPEVRQMKVFTSNDSRAVFDELMVRHTGWNAYTEVVSADSFVINNIPVGK